MVQGLYVCRPGQFPAAAVGFAFACSSLVGLNAPFTLFQVLWRTLVLGDSSDVEFCAARHDDPAASAAEAATMPPPALLDLPRFQLPLL